MSVTERVIFEQFPFWRSALKLNLPRLPNKTFVFVGCGTSYYLAQTLAAAFNLVGRDAVAGERESAVNVDGEKAEKHRLQTSGFRRSKRNSKRKTAFNYGGCKQRIRPTH